MKTEMLCLARIFSPVFLKYVHFLFVIFQNIITAFNCTVKRNVNIYVKIMIRLVPEPHVKSIFKNTLVVCKMYILYPETNYGKCVFGMIITNLILP